ncbi:ABC transporter permease [Candidatus Thorarchaeota archaeon]|nr:MAG: ABC transporter permease [Candidatus Thorarchaeota archaeon]
MAINYEHSERTETIIMEKPKKPLHVRIVSIGAFLLLSFTVLFALDSVNVLLSAYIAADIVGMTVEWASVLVNTLRIGAWVTFILTFILAIRGKKLYAHREGKYVQKLLIVTICFLVFVTLGIGWGLILTFGVFFWFPKPFVNWKELHLKIYRGLFLGIVFGWMLVESAFTSANIGITLLPQILTRTLTYFLQGDMIFIAILPLLMVFPIFIIAPRIIESLWKLRPKIETFWREFLYHPMGMIGLIIITAIVMIALLAPILAPYDWGAGSLQLEDLLQPPSPEHILGTNQRGEDIYSRLLYGSQISLLVGFVASVTTVAIGTFVGLISGYFGGVIDTILMRIVDIFLCLPTLPLMLIFLIMFGQGLQNVIIVIAILGWTGTARMVRAEALSLRERPLTEAAHALGGSDTYILIRHIMPNTLPLILANMILGVVNAILSEAGIAFLGFVDIHGQPSWGILLHWAWKNAALLANRWWWFIPPGLMILLTTLGFVFVSHTADKVVNPRLRGRRE